MDSALDSDAPQTRVPLDEVADKCVQQVKAELTNLCNYFEALAAMGARLVADPQLAAVCARMTEIQHGLDSHHDPESERGAVARRTSRQRNPRSGSAHPKPTTSTLHLEDRIMVMMHRHPKETHTPARILELLRDDGWTSRPDSLDKVKTILRDLATHLDSGVMEVGYGYYRCAPAEAIAEAKELISEVLGSGTGHLGVGTAEQVGKILIDGGWRPPPWWELVVDRALASMAQEPQSRIRRNSSQRYEFLPELPAPVC